MLIMLITVFLLLAPLIYKICIFIRNIRNDSFLVSVYYGETRENISIIMVDRGRSVYLAKREGYNFIYIYTSEGENIQNCSDKLRLSLC